MERFYLEAEAAAALEHPGIVPIYEVGEFKGQHFFSMGFVEGGSLAEQVKDGPLPPRRAAGLIMQVAEAVGYANDRGIIHRDLKPGNVLLDKDGKPKVTDFGVAKNVSSDSHLTMDGQIVGTASYMPPEQAQGHISEIGPASDVYSLGATLYCLVTGRPPFPGRQHHRDHQAGHRTGAGLTSPAQCGRQSRPGNHLPQMPAERTGQALSPGPGPGRRPAPVS